MGDACVTVNDGMDMTTAVTGVDGADTVTLVTVGAEVLLTLLAGVKGETEAVDVGVLG